MTTPSAKSTSISALQKRIWEGSLPLEIRLAPAECRTFDDSDPYLIQCSRLSYLPFLLPRLHAFFKSYMITPDVSPHDGWFEYEEVPLKWQHPVGLLFDLYSGMEPAQHDEASAKAQPALLHYTQGEAGGDKPDDDGGLVQQLPWRLTLHFNDYPSSLIRLDAEGKILHDAYINSVKEADYLRNGTAKPVMSLSKADSDQLWESVQRHNLKKFNEVNAKLLDPPGIRLRHIPLKVYLPHAAPQATQELPTKGTLRVVQGLVTPTLNSRNQPQTLGTALNTLIPSLFPSRRTPLLAVPVLHGAAVPLAATMEELLRAGAYADGWLHLGVEMYK